MLLLSEKEREELLIYIQNAGTPNGVSVAAAVGLIQRLQRLPKKEEENAKTDGKNLDGVLPKKKAAEKTKDGAKNG